MELIKAKGILFVKGFIEGCGIGATSVVIMKEYDKTIKSLPRVIRYPLDAFVGLGVTFIGFKVTDKIDH